MTKLKTRFNVVLLSLMCSLVFAGMLPPGTADALYEGRLSENQGYFRNVNVSRTMNDSVLPANNRCDYTYEGGVGDNAIQSDPNSRRHALPRDLAAGNAGNDKVRYRNYLRQQYNANRCSRGWVRHGVAFIVHTMLGHPPGSPDTLNSADWAEFDTKIINNNDIRMRYRSASSPRINSHSYGYGLFSAPTAAQRDIAFYTDSTPPTDQTFLFTGTNSNYRYEIKLRCANPSGVINTDLSTWSIAQDSAYIQRINSARNPIGGRLGTVVNDAEPGDQFGFFYRWRNQGPDATNQEIHMWRDYDYVSGPSSSGKRFGSNIPVNRPPNNIFYNGRAGNTNVIKQQDVGGSYCLRTSASPRSWNSGSRIYGTRLCVHVPYSYTLNPSVTDLDDVVEPGGNSSIQPRVTNSGPTRSRSSRWQLSKMIFGPGVSVPTSGGRTGSGGQPCSFHESRNATDCENFESGTGRVFNPGSTTIGNYTYEIEDQPAGTKICFALSVAPRSQDDSRWQHSAPTCVVVGKKPKVQINGGNLMVGRGFDSFDSTSSVETAFTNYKGRVFGSWSEYGILAPSLIDGMGSSAGLHEGGTGEQSEWSDLSFSHPAGSPCTGYGCYMTNRPTLPSVGTAFPIATHTARVGGASPNVSVGGLIGPTTGNGRVVTTNRPTLNITNSDHRRLNAGEWVVLNARDTHVVITDDIEYTNASLTNANRIPQLIIIADDITINSNVERVDAWLIVRRALSTCNQRSGRANVLRQNYTSSSARLSVEDCTRRLTVNGPVMADKLYLRRTAGSNPPNDMDTPAEQFNLRPDAYLWARQFMGTQNVYQTTNLRELPPRY